MTRRRPFSAHLSAASDCPWSWSRHNDVLMVVAFLTPSLCGRYGLSKLLTTVLYTLLRRLTSQSLLQYAFALRCSTDVTMRNALAATRSPLPHRETGTSSTSAMNAADHRERRWKLTRGYLMKCKFYIFMAVRLLECILLHPSIKSNDFPTISLNSPQFNNSSSTDLAQDAVHTHQFSFQDQAIDTERVGLHYDRLPTATELQLQVYHPFTSRCLPSSHRSYRLTELPICLLSGLFPVGYAPHRLLTDPLQRSPKSIYEGCFHG